MNRHHCEDCDATGELRRDNQPTGFGPRHALTCETCYAKDAAERRAEARRCGYRANVVPWSKLEIVQAAESA